MSFAIDACRPATAPTGSRFHGQVLSSALFLGAVWVGLWLGRDLNWDFLNYHFYGASLLVDGRFDQDYFAASIQSYLNPLPYVPQYLMIRAGWHSQWIGAILAAFHALNVVLAATITRQLLPVALRHSVALPFLAGVTAGLAPLFLTTTGTSFSDPTTSVMVLAALLLLLEDMRRGERALLRVSSAGALLGAASGLKMTNAVLLVGIAATFFVAWWVLRTTRSKSRAAALLAACSVGWLLTHGYWSLLLWREFGNPLFPLFNAFFDSPDFPAITFRDERFVGAGPAALLTLPFDMLAPVQWLYAENVAVDSRFAVFVLLLATTAIVWLLLRRNSRSVPGPVLVPGPLVLLTTVFVVCYLLWGLTSKIGRYALPLWLLLGPLIVSWASVLLRRVERVVVLCMLVIGVQIYVLTLAGNPRWSPAPWSAQWVDVDAPPELVQRPVTLFTLGTQSFSVLVPFLHHETRVVNLVGQYVQPAGERMTTRLRQLTEDTAADRRVAFNDGRLALPYDGRLAPETRRDVDAVLSVYGLRTTGADCQALTIHLPVTNLRDEVAEGSRTKPKPPEFKRLHVCEVEGLDAKATARALADLAAVSRLFDAVEEACGQQLNPHGTETLRGRDGWMRVYFNSQNSLMTDGHHVSVRPFRSMVDVNLGRVERWQQTPGQDCPRLPAAILRLK